jgi:hypothetical protein
VAYNGTFVAYNGTFCGFSVQMVALSGKWWHLVANKISTKVAFISNDP